MPVRLKLWMCVFGPKGSWHSETEYIQTEAKVVDLEKQRRKLERRVDGALRDKIGVSHSCSDSSSDVMEKESLGKGGHPLKARGIPS